MTMNPLDRVKEWFMAQDVDIQNQLIWDIMLFHEDEDVRKDPEPARSVYFREYMNSEDLSPVENARRALFMTKLIDFVLASKDSDEDWEFTLDMYLSTRQRAVEQGQSTEYADKQLDNFHEKKARWMRIARKWNTYKINELDDNKIWMWSMYGFVKPED